MISGISRKIPAIRLSGFFLMLVAVSFLALSTIAYAEEITYTGDKNQLRKIPVWLSGDFSRVLFPGTEAVPLSSDNEVTVNYNPAAASGANPEFVFGGLSESDNSAYNSVVLINGHVGYQLIGGFNYKGGTAAGNKVSMSGGSVQSVTGGAGDRRAAGNTVIISGNSVAENVVGGFSFNGSVTGNTVVIQGGFVSSVVAGGSCVDGEASGNNVTISAGSVGGRIRGGFSHDGNATGNTVTLSGNPALEEAFIEGGDTNDVQRNAFTGNTLNFKSSGISALGVRNFEHYNFYLPEDMANIEAMLLVADNVNLQATTVTIFLQGNTKLRKGDIVALIHSYGGVSGSPKNKSCQVKQGGALYEFSIDTDSNNLWAEVMEISKAAK